MSKRTNRKYRAKVWAANGSGIEVKLRVGSSVRGYKLEYVEPLKLDADKNETEWYESVMEMVHD